ncbi:S8 family serine peptidase [Reyranella soli]|uniref:Peptidase S8/S53 domain-containing protein n=1 Tax=Reyranella soli TaxID=1230389 RepID=A0A512NQH0_9HYPH|nr:S8 family serine peptidase [Reyranella soli]GEP61172.1 hypothetical protein RSO01_83380 [Reyranella soli]
MAGVLVKVRGDGQAFRLAAERSFGARAVSVEPILEVPPRPGDAGLGLAPTGRSTWLRVQLGSIETATAWDQAHALLSPGQPFAAAGVSGVEAVEPDVPQPWLPTPSEKAADEAAFCAFDDQNMQGGRATAKGVAWNFGSSYSELAQARKRVGDKLDKIIIAHLDTGYDPGHITLPQNLRKDWQRSFVEGDPPNDASDRTPTDMKLLRNRGHGTGTLSLLAGNKLNGTSPSWPGFNDYVGGAPLAQIIPVRIANFVARFTTGTMVQGFSYARQKGAHVLSMSMGGLASQALADAVNLAYDAGVVMVTAAGNNFAGVPFPPKSIVFPARYNRVLAACGLMADGAAYAGLDLGTMQGNYGPASKMETALGAYTPNVPWAQIDCANIVDMDGAGTSSATPQIAAAAALWLAEYWDIVRQYSAPWMRVEAVRHSLFASAQKTTAKMGAPETREKIGQGVLKAFAALQKAPLHEADLKRLPPAKATWAWLDLLFGTDFGLTAQGSNGRRQMLALELTQMAQSVAAVDEVIPDLDLPLDRIPENACRRYLEVALDQGGPSAPLRRVLERALQRSAPPGVQVVPQKPVVRRTVKEPSPPRRRLRVYALDPSVAKSFDSVMVNETTLSVRWDDEPESTEPLRPGPVGEYLEVVDVDPASDRIYEPVDLNKRSLLAQDGLPPSEGNPQFHQQMVYAVAMTTIEHFERALGRPALWAPRRTIDAEGKYDFQEVRRLRLYPHALRTDNAYYSPDKKAILFGYFPSESSHDDMTTPGSMVFSCLSSDIIAHEMSHALLDGLHRRFEEASNPDVPAFHEAFADIVALFQHFNIRELVRFEIARARGNAAASNLLAGLAKQFGEGLNKRGPLRNYADQQKLRYEDTREPHDLGSILVYAVYEAFLRIVARRTEGLIRVATGGSGILPRGALQSDLVDRLTDETCKTASYVLQMCIRALDYCPSVDITLPEYLRALITADRDIMPEDRDGQRVAFMEAFRRRGILPPEIRTVSVETLAWNTLEDPHPEWLHTVLEDVDFNLNRDLDRSQIFALNEKNRWAVWRRLKKVFAQAPAVYAQFGLLPGISRYNSKAEVVRPVTAPDSTFDVFSVRPARRILPDGTVNVDLIVVVTQRRPEPVDGKDIANGWFWFRGGATLIIDPRQGRRKPEIRYIVVKNSSSQSRLRRQRETVSGAPVSALRALYFQGRDSMGMSAEPFALMHDRDLQ